MARSGVRERAMRRKTKYPQYTRGSRPSREIGKNKSAM